MSTVSFGLVCEFSSVMELAISHQDNYFLCSYLNGITKI